MLQNAVENAILVPHGVDPPFVSKTSLNPWKRLESMPCASSTKINRTAVRLTRASITQALHRVAGLVEWMAVSSTAMTERSCAHWPDLGASAQ
jgi:hypothetical protein